MRRLLGFLIALVVLAVWQGVASLVPVVARWRGVGEGVPAPHERDLVLLRDIATPTPEQRAEGLAKIEQTRVSRLLLARSLKAGPLYVLRELPALMARHPFVTVCIGIVLAVVLWLIRWRRAVGAVTTR